MPHILACIGFLILSGMGNIRSCLDTHSVSLGFSKNCSGWWLADRPSAVTLLYYSCTLIQQFDIFSFVSFQPPCQLECLSWTLHRLRQPPVCPTMPSGLQECRPYARSVICGVRPRSIVFVCVRVPPRAYMCGDGSPRHAERRRTRSASSLDCLCGVAKEAEPSETG